MEKGRKGWDKQEGSWVQNRLGRRRERRAVAAGYPRVSGEGRGTLELSKPLPSQNFLPLTPCFLSTSP